MSQLVTRAEFARMRGVSRKTVTKWVEAGRIAITPAPDGREMIDPAMAAAALTSSQQRAQIVGDLLSPDDDAAALEKDRTVSLTALKAQSESERALLLRMERMEREGLLISREQVELEQEIAARIVRRALDALPSLAEDLHAAGIAGGALAVRKALKGMVRDVQASLSKALSTAASQLEAQRSQVLDDTDDAAA